MNSKPFKNLLKAGGEHAAYVGALVLSAITHFVYSVYVKRSIAPQEYGIYSTCLLLQTYLMYIQMGVMNSFNRDYPQLLGAGRTQEAKQYRNTAFTYLFFVFLIAQAIISLVFFLFGNLLHMNPKYMLGFVLASIIAFVTVLENFGASRVRIDGGFLYTSAVTAAETVSVLIGLVLVSLVGYYALYLTTIINMLIGVVLYYHRGFKDLKLDLDKKLLKGMILSGLPLLINNLIWTVVNSVDKIVILSTIDTEALGVYSIAQMAFSYVVLIPTAMSQLFYVNMGKAYGAKGDVEELSAISENYMKGLAVIVSLIVICAYCLIGPLVQWLMPNYTGGIQACQILMLGLAIYAPTMVSSNILTILKKNAALLRGSVYLCVLNFIFSFGFVFWLGANIESVALGTSVSYLIRTAILVVQLRNDAGVNPRRIINGSILPVLGILLPGILVFHFSDNQFIGFASALFVAVLISIFLYRDQIVALLKGERKE